jgi:hypothetical protein
MGSVRADHPVAARAHGDLHLRRREHGPTAARPRRRRVAGDDGSRVQGHPEGRRGPWSRSISAGDAASNELRLHDGFTTRPRSSRRGPVRSRWRAASHRRGPAPPVRNASTLPTRPDPSKHPTLRTRKMVGGVGRLVFHSPFPRGGRVVCLPAKRLALAAWLSSATPPHGAARPSHNFRQVRDGMATRKRAMVVRMGRERSRPTQHRRRLRPYKA